MALMLAAGNLSATTVALVGGQGTAGHVDGETYSKALFNAPGGMAMDSFGDLWLADTGNNAIREISNPLNSQGGGSETITFEPAVTTSLIVKPIAVAFDNLGYLYILDYGNGKNGNIVEYDPDYYDILETNAMNLTNAAGMAMDPSGNIYVTVNSNQILEVTAPGVSHLVATITNAGASLKGLIVKKSGATAGLIAVCDSGRNGIYLVNPTTGMVTTNAGFHGAGDFPSGTDASSKLDAQFNQPMGLAETGDGSLIVTDYGNNRVKVVKASDGGVTNLYGVVYTDWVSPYPGFSSTLNPHYGVPEVVVVPDTLGGVSAREPDGVVMAPDGTVYVTEEYYNLIRDVTGSGLPLPPPPAPLAPTGLTAVAGYGQVTLTWTASAGATNYNVKRSLDYDGTFSTVAGTSASSYTDTNIVDNTTYYYVISAANSGGTSLDSDQASATPLFSPPPTIQSVTTNYGLVSLTWSTSVGATSYIVERSPDSGTNFTPIATVPASTTSYNDTSSTDPSGVVNGTTYYYVIQAANDGGVNPTNSAQVSATPPLPPVPNPQIGWVTYPPPIPYTSVFNPGSPAGYTFNNDVDLVIVNPSGTEIYFTYANTTVLTNVPDPNSSSAPGRSGYTDGLPAYTVEQNYIINPLVGTAPALMIKAIGEQAGHPNSAIVSALFQFIVANPSIPDANNANAAQFTLTNITVGSDMYYTTDGSYPNPTNGAAVGPITNGAMLSLSFPPGVSNLTFESVGYRASYQPSSVYTNIFAASNYVANTLSWGFSSGECSSAFVGAAGETFYAPVTLTLLPGSNALYSLQFNMTVSSTGPGVTNSAPAAEPFNFQSMLLEPVESADSAVPVYGPIPPWMFASYETTNLPPSDYVTNSIGQVFVNLLTSNGNELAVGWLERAGHTNLYNTGSQTLVTFSQAHDDMFPNGFQPDGVIVGGYSFQISPGATNGQQYQIQLAGASATSDGIGAPGGAVIIVTPDNTNSTALGAGTLNGVKNVTVGSIPYLVGDVYPFRWFNAGDFGSSNLIVYGSADAEQVFEAAVYSWNTPPPGSDFFDAMDSAGGLGVVDSDPTSEFYGYWTNAGPATLLSGNITNAANQMAFGDGQLDVSDVYLTFLRSEFTNNFVWFQRLWTNGVRVATANWAPAIIPAVQTSSGKGKTVSANTGSNPALLSITNTPVVNFTATDYLATAGQTISIPITATVFGAYPLTAAMLGITVVPLDGSPALTTPVSFNAGALGQPTSGFVDSSGNGNYAAAWLPGNQSISGSGIIGTLIVTIPTNATSMSSYAIHFDHASASPNGLVSFPKHTLTGLITLSSRTSSYYNDGIPDSWRLRYFGTIYNMLSVSNADADGTGMENWQKYEAGLDPLDPASKLTVGTDQVVQQSQQDSVIAWPSVSGETYIIQRSATLFPPAWVSVSTNIGTGSYMEIHDSPTNFFRYYRVEAQ